MENTNIVLVKPHDDGCYKNGITKTTYQEDGKNIVATSEKKVTVNQKIIDKEHQALITTLEGVNQGDIITLDFPDTVNNKSLQELNILIEQKRYNKFFQVIGISNKELNKDLQGGKIDNKRYKGTKGYSKKAETKEEYAKSYFDNIQNGEKKFAKDSFVYIRDTFISNQRDKILISNFKKRDRRFQSKLTLEVLKNLTSTKDIIINANPDEYFEGGDFRYIPKNNLLFAGYTKGESRNSKKGIEYVKQKFKLNNNNILTISGKNAFHIDTFFSVATADNGEIVAGIICDEICNNIKEVESFFKQKGIKLFKVGRQYGIGFTDRNTGEKNIGKGITNTLQINEHLISSDYFTDGIENFLESAGVKRHITKVNEFRKAGGGIHCLTNQL